MWEDEAVQSIASYYRMWSLALTWVTGVAIYLQILSDIFSQSLQRPTIFPRRWNWKIIVTIWKVVFANKSRTLGWIWMKLGRWGWGLKRLILIPCTFPAKSRYGFLIEREKMGRRGVVFCEVNDAPLLPLSFDRFPPNFPRTRVHVVARDIWFHIPEKFK